LAEELSSGEDCGFFLNDVGRTFAGKALEASWRLDEFESESSFGILQVLHKVTAAYDLVLDASGQIAKCYELSQPHVRGFDPKSVCCSISTSVIASAHWGYDSFFQGITGFSSVDTPTIIVSLYTTAKYGVKCFRLVCHSSLEKCPPVPNHRLFRIGFPILMPTI
jgi:hypothetical protein